MRRRFPRRRLLVLLFTLLATAAPAFAQQPDPNVNILYPPSIYALSGSVDVLGTANVSGMTSYFLEFRPLIDASTTLDAGTEIDATAEVDGGTEVDAAIPWQPATLPSHTPVIGGVLGTWDTTLVPTGLYELRLTVFTSNNQAVYAINGPLRIVNTPPTGTVTPTNSAPAFFVVTATPLAAIIVQPQPQIQPQLTAAPQNPMAQAALDANVRAGDSTLYAPVGALLTGQTAPIIGRSARSTWWLIQLPNGRQGWIAPSTVMITGDTSGVPYATPPELTTAPTAAYTATPAGTPNLPDAVVKGIRMLGTPRVNSPGYFAILMTVWNQSSAPMPPANVACHIAALNLNVSQLINGLASYGQTDVEISMRFDSVGNTAPVTAVCIVDEIKPRPGDHQEQQQWQHQLLCRAGELGAHRRAPLRFRQNGLHQPGDPIVAVG